MHGQVVGLVALDQILRLFSRDADTRFSGTTGVSFSDDPGIVGKGYSNLLTVARPWNTTGINTAESLPACGVAREAGTRSNSLGLWRLSTCLCKPSQEN